MTSKRILLVAGKLGYQTRVFAEAGARLGYEVQLATDRCHMLDNPWGDGAISVDFANPTTFRGSYDGIVAVGDQPAEVASLLAEANGLRFHPPAAAAAARNKHAARQKFAAAGGLLVPRFERLTVRQATSDYQPFAFPCVLKPLTLSASRGVIRANDLAEFREAAGRIGRMLSGPGVCDDIQVEEFIPGREYALEGLMTDGELHVFAIFDKPDPLDGPFFEETIYVTPSRSADQDCIIAATKRAVRALGLTHGPIHAEMRVNDAGVWMLEAAARPIGGLCGQVLRTASGRRWEEVILRHAAGDGDGRDERLRAGGSGVMMIPIPRRGVYRGVAGIEEAAQVPGIEGLEITAKEGQEMIPLPEGASYLGFLFAHALTPAEAENALREAHGKLKFELAQSLTVTK